MSKQTRMTFIICTTIIIVSCSIIFSILYYNLTTEKLPELPKDDYEICVDNCVFSSRSSTSYQLKFEMKQKCLESCNEHFSNNTVVCNGQ